MARSITHDLTTGSPTKLILKFSTPMLIGNLFQQFYNMVDSIVVGNVDGKDALAAVGATGPLIFLIFGLTFGLSAGISIVISQYFGAKDYDNVRKGFATATYIIIIAALIMGTIGFFSTRWLLELLNTHPDIIDQSEIYMKISFAGILGIACYNGMAAILRALGDSITPLVFLIFASLLNVGLDLLFVINFNMGVPGVAIATVISQVLSAVACIIYALAKVKILRMPLREFKPDPAIFKKCIRIGVPVAIQNSFVSISLMAMQRVINGFSKDAIAAANVINRIEQLVLQPSLSLGAAVAAFTGQNIGADRMDRAKQGMKSATKIILVFSLLAMPIMYFGSSTIMKLFTKKEDFEVVRIGIQGIRVTCFFYFFVAMIFVTRNFLSGTGDIHVPTIMGFSEVIERIVFAIVLSHYIGFMGVFWASALTWVLTSIIGVLRVLSGKWEGRSVVKQQA